jgi:DNA-binding beta-propeller fold protein YncE
VQTTFASGLSGPNGVAFNSAGNLFELDLYSGNINEFTPGGAESTFASGLTTATALAFDSADNLFVANNANGSIYEFTPGGVQSTFATGLDPFGLAVQPAPEPSSLGMLAAGAAALLISRLRRQAACR